MSVNVDEKYCADIDAARAGLHSLALDGSLAPAFLRLACHDAWTFDAATKTGGANGSIRTDREASHPGNEGLNTAIDAVEGIKLRYPTLTYADLIALAGVVALEVMGGPKVAFTPGRKDSRVSPPSGRLPAVSASVPQAFARMGLSPRHAAALCGCHPLGLLPGDPVRVEASWHPKRSAFDNTLFRALVSTGGPPLAAPAAALMLNEETAKWVKVFAADNEAFRAAYAEAFATTITLGTALQPPRAAPAPSSADTWALTSGQLATGVVVVAAAGVVAGYLWGRRRRVLRF